MQLRHFFSQRSLFLALSLSGFMALGGGLTACSPSSSNSSSSVATETATPVSNPETVAQHGGMSHGNHAMMMDLGPADQDYDLRFIDGMIPHHQGAIEMAKQLQQKSTRPELQKLANEIISAQEKEIAQMQQWRKTWYPNAADSVAYHAQAGHSAAMTPEQHQNMMMNVDLGNADDQFDFRFLNAMIPHHEGAVFMAKDALNKSKRPEIQQLANAIITSQEQEINQMKQWSQDWSKK